MNTDKEKDVPAPCGSKVIDCIVCNRRYRQLNNCPLEFNKTDLLNSGSIRITNKK